MRVKKLLVSTVIVLFTFPAILLASTSADNRNFYPINIESYVSINKEEIATSSDTLCFDIPVNLYSSVYTDATKRYDHYRLNGFPDNESCQLPDVKKIINAPLVISNKQPLPSNLQFITDKANIDTLIYDDGSPENCYCWANGARMASRMSPIDSCKILAIQIYCYSAQSYKVGVYDWTGSEPSGALLETGIVSSSGQGWNTTDISSYNINVSGDFIASFNMIDTVAALGFDASNNGRAWDYDGSSWSSWNETYFIRAIVEYNGVIQNFTKHTIDCEFDGAFSVYATDMDGDNDIDVLGVAHYADQIAWWENDGDENFTKHIIDDDFDGALRVHATDMDGDGDVDVLGVADLDHIAWWENDGSQNFTRHHIGSIADADCYPIDLDSDDDIDVLGSYCGGGEIAWWENDGDENFTKHIIVDPFYGVYGVYATDVDGDDDVDVLGAAMVDGQIAWWENDGDENFTKHIIGGFHNARRVHATDIDGDDDVDVVGAGCWGSSPYEIAWWENDGDENFTKHTIDNAFCAFNIYVTDMDCDDDIDVLGADLYADEIVWWVNDGTQNFTRLMIDNDFNGANSVYAIDMDSDDDMDLLGAARYGDEIAWWENSFASTDEILLPETFFATHNYPNPFWRNTRIEYELPRDCKVRMTIYNLSGQIVATLINEIKEAGYYKVEWDGKDDRGSNLPSGIYFYRIEAADFCETRKMILLR